MKKESRLPKSLPKKKNMQDQENGKHRDRGVSKTAHKTVGVCVGQIGALVEPVPTFHDPIHLMRAYS